MVVRGHRLVNRRNLSTEGAVGRLPAWREDGYGDAMDEPLTYGAAGVNVDEGERLVDLIRPLVAATRRPGADGTVGGFGGVFDLGALAYRDPLLVAANDGVGTKVKLAIETGRHDTVGIDLVAMCVNDLVVQGAEPLLFLDYFATAALDAEEAARVVSGIAEGCRQAGCALLGGETAEMPGLYAAGDYDLAGFALGIVERGGLLPRDVAEGDVLIGLPSSGVHSNGYSLVRRIVERTGLGWGDAAPFEPSTTLGEALLEPTHIYVRTVLDLVAAGGVHALAHVTGGGITQNLPRVLPKGLGARVELGTWNVPPVFPWLAREGAVEEAEMLRTFNCGIGMILVADADRAETLAEAGSGTLIGRVVAGEGVSYDGRLLA